MGRRFTEEEQQTIWEMREAGVPVKRIAKHLGRQIVSLRKFIADQGAGGTVSSGCVRTTREVQRDQSRQVSHPV